MGCNVVSHLCVGDEIAPNYLHQFSNWWGLVGSPVMGRNVVSHLSVGDEVAPD